MAVLRKDNSNSAGSLALALPGVEKSALGPLRPLLELLAPLMEQAQAAQSSRSKGSGGLSNLQIFGTGKRAAARDPSRSPRSDLDDSQNTQEQPPKAAPMTAMVPAEAAQSQKIEVEADGEEYNPEQDAEDFAKAKEDRKRKRLEEKEEKAGAEEKPKPAAKAAKKKPKASAKSKAKAKAKAAKETKDEDEAEVDKQKETQAPAKKTRQPARVFSGPERPPVMKDGDPTTYYLQGKVNRNSNLHCFLRTLCLGTLLCHAFNHF